MSFVPRWRVARGAARLVALFALVAHAVAAGAQDAPTASPERGFYSSPIQVALSTAAGLDIRYTLDASTPTPHAGT